ncbi:MAG: hypothetical protein ABIO49_01315 [Dokdonella sp.]
MKRDEPRAHFLKSAAEDSRCPAPENECAKQSYLVPGNQVLAWAREKGTVCAMYAAVRRKVTVGRLSESALDFHGTGKPPLAKDWIGHWKSDRADIHIRGVDARHIEIEGDAMWGADDPARVANGSVHTGEIELTRARLTGYTLHIFEGQGNAPPEHDDKQGCYVDLTLLNGTLLVKDDDQCGGQNVTFSGEYQRVAP